uniref:Uncharacterized protein n=1 Tax=Chromera velia CCMP2878 TaxID=1169474 RepID=A0A0G4HG86_9ALVE|eukprot:Cvel_27137.t1-p1 / transcript=Cvel_27137.t1 / gene=Cvel_27137 / organism=Chromera_velia_CCMP2878 / gene_product=hypothetical protein / transcript_product=hypothetical protein / location=Cvel_scaffold3336:8095-8787(-) / protein_length=231 / sequence_SO=supercontig / SO=protein_coding / is_pseudo=false
MSSGQASFVSQRRKTITLRLLVGLNLRRDVTLSVWGELHFDPAKFVDVPISATASGRVTRSSGTSATQSVSVLIPNCERGCASIFFALWREPGGVEVPVALKVELVRTATHVGFPLWRSLSSHPLADRYFVKLLKDYDLPKADGDTFVVTMMTKMDDSLEKIDLTSHPSCLKRAVVEKVLPPLRYLHAGNRRAGGTAPVSESQSMSQSSSSSSAAAATPGGARPRPDCTQM